MQHCRVCVLCECVNVRVRVFLMVLLLEVEYHGTTP